MGGHRTRLVMASIAALVLTASACTHKGTSASKPLIGGAVGFDTTLATQANGPIPSAAPDIVCGSSTATFGTELLTTSSPQNAKVQFEWGEIVPGQIMAVSGTVENFQFSMGDLPFTHPFDKDVTLDVALDKPYGPLSQLMGTEVPPGPLSTLHFEISRGLVPHSDTSTYLEGFVPQNGDRIAAMGHWIVDCGHNDYHTELHPPTFVAFGHTEGAATVSHAFANPYYETGLYTPIPALVTEFNNPDRFNDPNTLTFPQYLYQELIRVGHLGPKGDLCCTNELQTHMLLSANNPQPVTWYVCAPGPKPSGATLGVTERFTVRPGISISAAPNQDTGCVGFTARRTSDYLPLVPERKDCVLKWSQLDQQAAAATGNPNISVKGAIEKLVPPSFIKAVERNPIVDCFDPLVVPAPGGGSQSVLVSASQPYPFYGTATVAWQPSH